MTRNICAHKIRSSMRWPTFEQKGQNKGVPLPFLRGRSLSLIITFLQHKTKNPHGFPSRMWDISPQVGSQLLGKAGAIGYYSLTSCISWSVARISIMSDRGFKFSTPE